ncbi:splicing factor 3B subunit 4-like isoform X3 [Hyla sarda]|nr:splicing factor 3B subunit 4-like isoform X3 [Hyla sarda]
MPIDRFEYGVEPRKFRGRGNRGRGNFVGRAMKGPLPLGREKFLNKPMNGMVPMRRGMGRMHPYMDPRGHRGMRGRPPGFLPPPPPPLHPREMGEPFPPPPPPPPPPLAPLRRGHPLPPPPGLMGFRGMPPPPRGRGMLPPPPRGNFSQPRG